MDNVGVVPRRYCARQLIIGGSKNGLVLNPVLLALRRHPSTLAIKYRQDPNGRNNNPRMAKVANHDQKKSQIVNDSLLSSNLIKFLDKMTVNNLIGYQSTQ